MKKYIYKIELATFLFIVLTFVAINAFSQDKKFIKTIEDISIPKEDIKGNNMLKTRAEQFMARTNSTRPKRVNNAENMFFPPVFSQDRGSCGSASRICYMFGYEINVYRNMSAKLPENQYPSHFTWLQTGQPSGDKTQTAMYNGIPNIVDYGGRTYSTAFGNQDCSDNGYGKMQGYQKWYRAMYNRLERSANISGIENMKNWIWNHCGDESYKAGGVIGIAYLSNGAVYKQIPLESHEAGKWIIAVPSQGYDHATTLVGYDDDVEYDINENGKIDDDEKGAWIMANSWGDHWKNNGFVYMPYSMCKSGEIYHIRRDYVPKKTIRITMKHYDRNKIKLKVGTSFNPNAVQPDNFIELWSFCYDGNDNSTMLGKWTDGWHSESMDFGYDLTDFVSKIGESKYIKWFFVAETVEANAYGIIDSVSLKDYNNGSLVKSVDFPEKNVTFKNDGRTTTLTLEMGKPSETTVDTTKHPFSSDYSIKLGGYNNWEYFTLNYNLATGKMYINTNSNEPHIYFYSRLYSWVEILDEKGNSVYKKMHYGAKSAPEDKTIPVKEGYRIKIYHAEGSSPARFYVKSNLFPNTIGASEFSNLTQNVEFEITTLGLKVLHGGKAGDPKDLFYNRTCEFFNHLIARNNTADLYDVTKLTTEKNILMRAYNLFTNDQKAKFISKFVKYWPLDYCAISIKNSNEKGIFVKDKSGKIIKDGDKIKNGSEIYISVYSLNGGQIKEIMINKSAQKLSNGGNLVYKMVGNTELALPNI